jgi:hypothetical protein
MKKSFGTVIALVAAALVLGLIACKGTADSPSILWISLYGPTPTAAGTSSSFTATLSLDFSAPVADLKAGPPSSTLNDIFSFTYYNKGGSTEYAPISAISLTPDEMGGDNTYRLLVSGVPANTGTVEVTMNRSGIEPPVRTWYLDGSHDYAPPAILDFRFLAADRTLIGTPGIFSPGSTADLWDIGITVPASVDVTKLTPTITLNPGNLISPSNQTPQDFTKPLRYTVSSGSGAAKTYLVTVTPANSQGGESWRIEE